jgi:hypothetical protein
MTVKALFQTWTALKDILTDPHLPENHSDLLVEQSMQIIAAMTNTPSGGLMDVMLKLETYGREVEAGPCAECDALLGSALRDRANILERLGKPEVAASGRYEHRRRPLQERSSQDDRCHIYTPRRGEDSRPSHP